MYVPCSLLISAASPPRQPVSMSQPMPPGVDRGSGAPGGRGRPPGKVKDYRAFFRAKLEGKRRDVQLRLHLESDIYLFFGFWQIQVCR